MSPVRPKKHLGQHFLHHRDILERITDALDLNPGALVLEIGPGQGGLTACLAARGVPVAAIEKDPDLAALIENRLPQVKVIVGDALEVDWRAAVRPWPHDRLIVAGNIPYNITSPLLDKALAPPRPERIVFLVQKEVAERVAAGPGSRAYGALSVGVQAVARVEKLFLVPAGAFHPKPKVDSAVLRLTPLSPTLIADDEVARFRRLVVGLFGFRRKQLTRALRELAGWPPDRVASLLAAAGQSGVARPETVTPAGFVRLFSVLIDAGWPGH